METMMKIDWKEEVKACLHCIVYPLFFISLYLFTKPLAHLVDLVSPDGDTKFMD